MNKRQKIPSMTVGELVRQLQRHDRKALVYVYDEQLDRERVIESVDNSNHLMTDGIVISIRGIMPTFISE